MPQDRILLGVIGRPHGVRGHVRVTSHTADPAALAGYGPLSDGKGRRFALRWQGEGVAEISEVVNGTPVKITDRSAAEKLTNTPLFIDRAALPAPEEDEFYLADLVGLMAVDGTGGVLGTVTAVHDYGAGASLEIERQGSPPLLVPFSRACVPEVEIAAGRLTVLVPQEVEGSVAPSPLEGEGGGEGANQAVPPEEPLSPTLPRKGGGSRAAESGTHRRSAAA